MSTDRAKLAYVAFRGGFREDKPCPVPHWDQAPDWVRDVVLVAYLQGKLDAPSIQPSMQVVLLQPDADAPGLWIGFENYAQRDGAMKLFRIAVQQNG